MIADTSEIITTSGDENVGSNVNKMHWFRKALVLVIAGVCLGTAVYFTIQSFVIHAQRNDSDAFDYYEDYLKLSISTVYIYDSNVNVLDNDNYITEEETTSKFQEEGTTSNFQEEEEEEFRIITRAEWGAQNPQWGYTNLELPSIRVIIAHTVTGTCLTQVECSSKIQEIQRDHILQNWSDIGYNFLVGGDGSAYIGRGWDNQGAHSGSKFNPKSICIAFIGTFSEIIPPQRQIAAAQNLIVEGLRLEKLDFLYRLYGHRQVTAQESPGDALYAIIQEWDNWSDDVI